MRRQSSGFTLIELLVVIAIIGVLSSVVLSSLNTTRAKSRDAQRLSDAHQLETAIKTWEIDNNTRIAGLAGGSYSEPYYPNNPTNGFVVQNLKPNYMTTIPNDPRWDAAYSFNGGNAYYYVVNATSAWISANSWSYLTAGCAGYEVLVIKTFETTATRRQDCPLSIPNAMSIILQ